MITYIHKVQYYETDQMGITHHSNYVRWMEEARVNFLAQIGWNYDRLEAMGIISPVTAVECHYKATTTFPDEISIEVEVVEFKGVRLKLRYLMTKADGTLACEGNSEHCFLGTNGMPLRLKKVCPEFAEKLTELVKSE